MMTNHYRWPDMRLDAAELRCRVANLSGVRLRDLVEIVYRYRCSLSPCLDGSVAPRGAAQPIAATATAPDREAALVPRHRQKNIPRVPRETTCAAAASGPRPG